MRDDEDLDRPASQPIRFEAAVSRHGRAPAIVAGVAIAFVGIALLKPWAWAVGPDPSGGPARAGAVGGRVQGASRGAAPSPSTAEASIEAVQAFCMDPGSWRTATIEQWSTDQTVRVWRRIEPRRASGPTDPGIDAVPAVGETVPAIGYCAPVGGPERPSGPAAVVAWRVDGPLATEIDLRRLAPVDGVSELGALWAPPVAGATSWPDGRYVFRFVELAAGADAVWFAVEVRTEPLPDGGKARVRGPVPKPPTSEVMQPGGGLGAFFLP
jgi:hypothetical protein